MIVGLGTDIVPINRIERILARNPRALPEFVLSVVELVEYKQLPAHKQVNFIAKRVCAKEALAKALGTGIRDLSFWKEHTLGHTKLGQPVVTTITDHKCHITISDTSEYATATVILEDL
jgi:holo-[acyl-carrier protein] synthase